jgi:23S rRNA pseudouridine2604 synthase
MNPDFPMRLNKYLAQQGYATRRSADTLIEKKRVFVNGKVATLGQKVEKTDLVELKDFDTTHFRYILYNKPRGVITHSPESHETDIVTQLKKDHKISGVFPVGRLDKDSEGLILLTNDGRITDRILNPDQEHEREYEVTVDKKVSNFLINNLTRGVNIEGYVTKPAKADKVNAKGREGALGQANPKDDRIFKITLTEGKKHQVRRMCAALGFQVKTLKRTRILDLTIKNLKPGAFYELKPKEFAKLQETLGLR